MKKNKLSEIKAFLEPKRFAFIGLSSDPKKFSRAAYKELSGRGFKMLPVNPKMEELDGVKCYKDISELPEDVKHALIMTPKSETLSAVGKAIDKGIHHIWIQQGAETEALDDLAKDHKITMINKACILMFAQPVGGVHGFHRFLSKVFRTYPVN